MTARHEPRRNSVLVGDAAQRLHQLPDHYADMLLTSPPYFRLRDYQVPGQLGLEQHVDDWVNGLRQVAQEAHRVLTPTGTFWLNVADTYATHRREGATPKSLLLGPERLALALLEDGWILRNKIVWAKPNPMPTSVRDRLTASWEALYLFVQQPGYFFDLDAVRQPHRSRPRRPAQSHPGGSRRPPGRDPWLGPAGAGTGGLAALKARGLPGHPLGKNPTDVWSIAKNGYRSDHHAAFPVELARRAILAGCPERRCSQCYKPWKRTTVRQGDTASRGALQPTCDCQAASERGLVLDPFIGAGTTAVAADALQRDWLGIELNPAFADLARRRVQQARDGSAPTWNDRHTPPPGG